MQGIRSDRQMDRELWRRFVTLCWRTMDGGLWHPTEGIDQNHPQEKEMQQGKMVVLGGLTKSLGKKRSKRQRRKGKIYHLNAEFQRIARRDKKTFLTDQHEEIEENNRMGNTRDLFKKIRDTKGIFHAKRGTIKDRSGVYLSRRY